MMDWDTVRGAQQIRQDVREIDTQVEREAEVSERNRLLKYLTKRHSLQDLK